MNEPTASSNYPPWLLQFNRVITSRPITYLAAAIFAIAGASRLADGRIARGFLNLIVAGGLIGLRSRSRRSALGERHGADGRSRWAARHPVIGAVALGAAWGAMMSAFLVATTEGSIGAAVAVGLGTGLLFFGPVVVLVARRYERQGARIEHS